MLKMPGFACGQPQDAYTWISTTETHGWLKDALNDTSLLEAVRRGRQY
jgi:hypothetical protein